MALVNRKRKSTPREKYPSEKFNTGPDFANDLAREEEVIVSFTAQAWNKTENEDASTTFLDQTTKAIVGSQTVIQVRGGVAGEEYEVLYKATTDCSHIYSAIIVYKIIDENQSA